MTTVRVGLCEDDDELRGAVADALRRHDYDVVATATGADALARYAEDAPDVLILDIGLPDADGRDVCQALRARGVDCPVVFLTARSALTDRLSGFSAGGDDYVVKPFALTELLARIQALSRRHSSAPAAPETGLRLDAAGHALAHGSRSVTLTPTEFRILAALLGRRGEVVRRTALVAAAWPDGAIVNDNTLDSYVARIRRRLREVEAEEALETMRGVGYVIR